LRWGGRKALPKVFVAEPVVSIRAVMESPACRPGRSSLGTGLAEEKDERHPAARAAQGPPFPGRAPSPAIGCPPLPASPCQRTSPPTQEKQLPTSPVKVTPKIEFQTPLPLHREVLSPASFRCLMHAATVPVSWAGVRRGAHRRPAPACGDRQGSEPDRSHEPPRAPPEPGGPPQRFRHRSVASINSSGVQMTGGS